MNAFYSEIRHARCVKNEGVNYEVLELKYRFSYNLQYWNIYTIENIKKFNQKMKRNIREVKEMTCKFAETKF